MGNAPSTTAAKLRVAALTGDGLALGQRISGNNNEVGGHYGVATHVRVEDTLADVYEPGPEPYQFVSILFPQARSRMHPSLN